MTAILKVDTIQDTAGNNIINESSNTITIGASGDTTNIVGTLQNNGSALISGITEADIFRLTSNVSTTGGPNDITSNLERADDASSGRIGTGMSESSGIFTFPSTGIYLVRCTYFGSAIPDDNVGMVIKATTNNSSYDDVAFNQDSGDGSSGASFTGSLEALVDVTDVSNVKVKFATDSISSGSIIEGTTTSNVTSFTFIRLGAT